MLIRQKTANAAKTSLFGAGVFSDARFDATSLRDYEISHKMDPSFLTLQKWAFGKLHMAQST